MTTRRFLPVVVIVAALIAAAPAAAVVSGTNGKILYTLQTPGNFDIWTVNSDGTGNAALITDAADDQGGAWSPDGTRIAFRSERTGGGDIYIANADGSNPQRLTDDPAQESHPSFSPDGTRIAFTRKDPDDEIFVMDTNPATNDAQRLTTNTVTDAGPDWSPDGTQIVFFRGNNVLHVMNADGTDQREFVPGTFSVGPQWSPDARRVVFQRSSGGIGDPHVVNADGTGLLNVGQELPGSAQAPSWSPDGTKIVVLSGTGESDMWLINPDGTGAVRILDDALVRSGPRWQPVPRAPTAQTDAAADITAGSALLTGTTDSTVLHPTTYFFEYGTTTAYGARTADAAAPAPVGSQSVSAGIGDLLPFTTYHFRLVARNAIGTTTGPDQVFSTNALAPLATTSRATATPTTAAFFGIVDPRGAPAEFRFDFGTDTSYGSATPTGSAPAAAAEVSGPVTGLRADTLYHYRVVASGPGGTTAGADATVHTARKGRPRALSLSARPRHDPSLPFRYKFSGRLRLPRGLSAAEACNGKVMIQLHRGDRRVMRARARLSPACAYRKVVSITNTRRLGASRGTLNVTTAFRGNAALTSRRARARTVGFG